MVNSFCGLVVWILFLNPPVMIPYIQFIDVYRGASGFQIVNPKGSKDGQPRTYELQLSAFDLKHLRRAREQDLESIGEDAE